MTIKYYILKLIHIYVIGRKMYIDVSLYSTGASYVQYHMSVNKKNIQYRDRRLKTLTN